MELGDAPSGPDLKTGSKTISITPDSSWGADTMACPADLTTTLRSGGTTVAYSFKPAYIPTPPISERTEMRIDPEDPDQNELPYFTFPPNSLIVPRPELANTNKIFPHVGGGGGKPMDSLYLPGR